MNYLLVSLYLIFAFFLNEILKYYKILPSYSGDIHQKVSSDKIVPLSGGIILLSFFVLFYDLNYEIFLCFSLMFLLGIFSDLKILVSPYQRFLIQIFISFSLVLFSDLSINKTSIELLDFLISHKYFNIFFLTLCILIVINGSNFLDGLNTLIIGYYLIISILLYNLNVEILLKISHLIIILVFLFFLNLSNRLYLGDNGSYFLGFLFSFILVQLHQLNETISPYFIVLLLWYPAIEILFSFIRKIMQRKSPMIPDGNHLHQILFININKKIKTKLYSNVLSAQIINIYNLISFVIGSFFINHTKSLIVIILINVIVYLMSYKILNKLKT